MSDAEKENDLLEYLINNGQPFKCAHFTVDELDTPNSYFIFREEDDVITLEVYTNGSTPARTFRGKRGFMKSKLIGGKVDSLQLEMVENGMDADDTVLICFQGISSEEYL